MRSLLSTMGAIAVVLALSGCPSRQQQPLPGPKSPTPSTSGQAANSSSRAAPGGGSLERGSPDEINWFQGTLEEAFTRRPRTDDRPLFR